MDATPDLKTPVPKTDLTGARTIRFGWILLSLLIALIAGFIALLQAPDPQPAKPKKSFLEWLRYPIETHPGVRLQSGPGQLNSIAFASNGKDGLAVGSGGIILASADGGETWTAQNSGVSSTLWDLYCDAKCNQAWVVGNGTILVTKDGGNHWDARRLEAADISFRAILVRKGGSAAWVMGYSSSIWATRDGGQTWQKTENPNSRPFLEGLCFDEQG